MAQGDFVAAPYFLPTTANEYLAGRVATVSGGINVIAQEVIASVAGYPGATSYGLPTVTVASVAQPNLAGNPTYYAGRGPATVVASGRLMGARFAAYGGDGYWRYGGASIVVRSGGADSWQPAGTYLNQALEVASAIDYLVEVQV